MYIYIDILFPIFNKILQLELNLSFYECFNHGLSIITYHEIPLTSLILPHVCACSKPETDFQRHMSLSILLLLV